jgi:hypothetical protein
VAFEGCQLPFIRLRLAPVSQPVTFVSYLVSLVGCPVSVVVVGVTELLAVVLQSLAFIERGGIDRGEGVALLGVDFPLFCVGLVIGRCCTLRRVDRSMQLSGRRRVQFGRKVR